MQVKDLSLLFRDLWEARLVLRRQMLYPPELRARANTSPEAV